MKLTIRLASILVLASLVGTIAFARDGQYFVRHGRNSDNMGPYSESELKTRLKNGLIKPTDYVWSASMKEWTEISITPIFEGKNQDRIPASDQSPPPFPGDEKKSERIEATSETAPTDSKLSGYAIPLIGLAFPVSNASGGPYFTIGGELGIHTKIGDVGIFADTAGNSATTNGVLVSETVTSLMLSLTNQTDIFYYGGRIGLGIRSVTASNSTTSLSSSGTSFAFAPVVGVRIPMATNISVDFETSWQNIVSGTLTGTLGSVPVNSLGYLIPLAGVRIIF